MDIESQILGFSEDINRYGYAIKANTIKNGVDLPLIPNFTAIHNLPGGSLYKYLLDVYFKTKPDKFIVVCKKRNGTGLKDPKRFDLVIENQPSSNLSGPITMERQEEIAYPTRSFSNVSNPVEQMYKMQIESLTREVNKYLDRAERFEKDFINVRNENFELKRQLDTIEEKHQLNIERERVKSENTLTGVLKEMKPEIHTLMGHLAEKNTPNQLGETSQLPETTTGKIIAILQTAFNSVDTDTQFEYLELLMRYAQLGENKMKFLEPLRKSTESFNETFENTKNELL